MSAKKLSARAKKIEQNKENEPDLLLESKKSKLELEISLEPLKKHIFTTEELAAYYLEETPEKLHDGKRKMRCLIKNDGGFHKDVPERYLIMCLRARNYNSNTAFILLKNFYRIPTMFPEYFISTKVSDFSDPVYSQNIFTSIQSDKQECGWVTMIFRAGKWNPSKASIEEVVNAHILTADYVLRNQNSQIYGVVVLIDWKDFRMWNCKYLTPSRAKKLTTIVQECVPFRYRSFHILHEPLFFNIIWPIIAPFLSTETRGLIHYHGDNLTDLHKYIPRCTLPAEYGGTLGNFDSQTFINTVLEHEQEISDSFLHERIYFEPVPESTGKK